MACGTSDGGTHPSSEWADSYKKPAADAPLLAV
jgi:hypothetical protein